MATIGKYEANEDSRVHPVDVNMHSSINTVSNYDKSSLGEANIFSMKFGLLNKQQVRKWMRTYVCIGLIFQKGGLLYSPIMIMKSVVILRRYFGAPDLECLHSRLHLRSVQTEVFLISHS